MGNLCPILDAPENKRLKKFAGITNDTITEIYQWESINGKSFKDAELTKEIYDFRLNKLHESVENVETHIAQFLVETYKAIKNIDKLRESYTKSGDLISEEHRLLINQTPEGIAEYRKEQELKSLNKKLEKIQEREAIEKKINDTLNNLIYDTDITSDDINNTAKHITNEFSQVITECLKKNEDYFEGYNQFENICRLVDLCNETEIYNVRRKFFEFLKKDQNIGLQDLINIALGKILDIAKLSDSEKAAKTIKLLENENYRLALLDIASSYIKNTEGILYKVNYDSLDIEEIKEQQEEIENVDDDSGNYTNVSSIDNDVYSQIDSNIFNDFNNVDFRKNISSQIRELFRIRKKNVYDIYGQPVYYSQGEIFYKLMKLCHAENSIDKMTEVLSENLESDEFLKPIYEALTEKDANGNYVNLGLRKDFFTTINKAFNFMQKFTSKEMDNYAVDSFIINDLNQDDKIKAVALALGREHSSTIFKLNEDDTENVKLNVPIFTKLNERLVILDKLMKSIFYKDKNTSKVQISKLEPNSKFLYTKSSISRLLGSSVDNFIEARGIVLNADEKKLLDNIKKDYINKKFTVFDLLFDCSRYLGLSSFGVNDTDLRNMILDSTITVTTNGKAQQRYVPGDHYKSKKGILAYIGSIERIKKLLVDKNGRINSSTDIFGNKGSFYRPYTNLLSLLNYNFDNFSKVSFYSDGKLYYAYVNLNFITKMMNLFKSGTAGEIREFLSKYIKDEFHSKFYDKPWFHSWLKDFYEKIKPYPENQHIDSEYAITKSNLFLTFNDQSWKKLNSIQYITAAWTSFLKQSKQSEAKKQTKTTMFLTPIMEAKSTEYFIQGNRIEDKVEHVKTGKFEDDISVASQYLSSVFMQEIYRIRKAFDKLYNSKEDARPEIDFSDKRKLGDLNFQFLPLFNEYFYKINDELNGEYSELEQDFFQKMKDYIITSVINKDDNSTDNGTIDPLRIEAAMLIDKWIKRESNNSFDSHVAPNILLFAKSLGYLKDHGTDFSVAVKNAIDVIKKEKQEQLKKKDTYNIPVSPEEIWEKLDHVVKKNIENRMRDSYKDFFMNQMFANMQMMMLFGSDLIFYDGWNDAQKRFAQFCGPILSYSVNTGESYYNERLVYLFKSKKDDSSRRKFKKIMTINDPEGQFLPTETIDFICESIRNERLQWLNDSSIEKDSEPYKRFIDKLDYDIKEIRKRYVQKNTPTDGATIMSIPFYIKHLKMLNRCSVELEDLLTELCEICCVEDDEERNKLFGEFNNKVNKKYSYIVNEPIKTFSYDLIQKDDQRLHPTQIKTAEQVVLDLINDPTMARLHKFMIENQIDAITTTSSVKVSKSKAVDIFKNGQYRNIKDVVKDLEKNANNQDYLINMPLESTGIQTETASHWQNFEGTLGVQFTKLLLEDIESTNYYNYNGQWIHGSDLKNLFESALGMKVFKGVENIRQKLGSNPVERNKKLSELLLTTLVNSQDFSFDAYYGLHLNRDGKFNMSLNDPSNSYLINKLFLSIIKKNLINLKIPGGQLVQVTDGIKTIMQKVKKGEIKNGDSSLDESLHMVYEYDKETGEITNIKYMEVELPFYYKELISMYMKDDGTIDMEEIKKYFPELLNLVCYRIPTEGGCSMTAIKVKRFSTNFNGGTIKLPAAITEITGSDFDIDKMFFIVPHLTFDKAEIVDNKPLPESEYKRYIYSSLNPSKMIVYHKPITFNSKYDLNGVKKAANDYGIENINNTILEVALTALTSKDTVSSRFNPGGFRTLKKLSKMHMIAAHMKGNYKDNYNKIANNEAIYNDELRSIEDTQTLASPETQLNIHQRNMTSKDEVGIFANHRQTHAFFVDHPITVKFPNNFDLRVNGIDFNKNKRDFIQFDPKFTFDGTERVSDNLRELLSAAVDAIKDPLLNDAGFNRATVNIALVLLRLGFNLETTVLIMKQPIIQKYIREYEKRSAEKSETGSTFIDIRDLFVEVFGEKFNGSKAFAYGNEKPNDKITLEITNDALLEYIGLEYESNIEKEQDYLLPLLDYVTSIVSELPLVIKMAKIDSSSDAQWKTVFDLVKYQFDIDHYKNLPQSERMFGNELFNIFDNEKAANYSVKMASYQTALDESIDLLYGTYNKFVFRDLKKAVQLVIDKTGREPKYMSSTTYRDIYNAMMTYKFNVTQTMNDKEYFDYYVNKFPNRVPEIMQQITNLELFDDNYFMKKLSVSPSVKARGKASLSKYLTLTLTGYELTPNEKAYVRSSIETLWQANVDIPNQKTQKGDSYTTRNFVEDLLKYCIVRNGFLSTNGSFIEFFPTTIKTRIEFYNNFMKSLDDVVTMGSDLGTITNLFIRHNRNLVSPYTKESIDESLVDHEFVKNKSVCYQRSLLNPNIFSQVVWLGADGICLEYHPQYDEEENGSRKYTMFKWNNDWFLYQDEKEKNATIEINRDLIKHSNLKSTITPSGFMVLTTIFINKNKNFKIKQDNTSFYRGQYDEPHIDSNDNLILYGKKDSLYEKAGYKTNEGVSVTRDLQSAVEYGEGQFETRANLVMDHSMDESEQEAVLNNGYYIIQFKDSISNKEIKEAGESKLIGDVLIPKGSYIIEHYVGGELAETIGNINTNNSKIYDNIQKEANELKNKENLC